MKIIKAEKQGEGYNVYMEGTDMIAYVHLKEEIEGLRKAGFIPQLPKPILKKASNQRRK